MPAAAVILGLTLISSDAYASEENYHLVQKAYKDRYGSSWHPSTIKVNLRDGKDWAVANAVVGRNKTDSLKRIFKNYISSDLSTASPAQVQRLILGYLANPDFAVTSKFVEAKDYEGLATLLQITGPEILLIPDANGKYPVPPSDLSGFLRVMEPYLPADGEIAKKLKTIFPTLLMENIEALINQINAFKKQYAAELKNEGRWGEKGQKLEAKEKEFSQCCDELRQTLEGRKLLRDYRFPDRSSLISYYAKELQKEQDWHERELLENNLQWAIRAYFEDGVPITAEALDISDLDSLRLFLNAARGEGAKNTLHQYRNRKGHNLAQLALTLEEEHNQEGGITYLRDLMQDNAAFLSLLRQTAPGTETAEEMLINTPWGMQILEGLDPAIWVKPGKYGITPLMRKALDPSDLQPYLDDLQAKAIPVTQTDLFGNTVESIRSFAANAHQYDFHRSFVVESLKGRPLQESLWHEYIEFPYFTRPGPIEDMLVIVHQQPQTPLHRAFLQVEVNHDQARVNSLWRSLFKAYDAYEDHEVAERRAILSKVQQRVKLLPAEHYEHQYLAEDMQRLEEESTHILAGRKLSVAERALGFLPVEQNPDAVANMLASGGTFGINFSRKVSRLGGSIMMKRCQEWGQHFGDKIQSILEQSSQVYKSQAYVVKSLNDDFGLALTEATLQSSVLQITEKLRERFKKPTAEIQDLFAEYIAEKTNIKGIVHQMLKDSLFQDYGSVLDVEKTRKLLNHRLNCAVVALFNFMVPQDRSSMKSSDVGQIFDSIDSELQGFLPAGQTANSRARFDRLNRLYGEVVE